MARPVATPRQVAPAVRPLSPSFKAHLQQFRVNNQGGGSTPSEPKHLLETGDARLLEDGSFLLLE